MKVLNALILTLSNYLNHWLIVPWNPCTKYKYFQSRNYIQKRRHLPSVIICVQTSISNITQAEINPSQWELIRVDIMLYQPSTIGTDYQQTSPVHNDNVGDITIQRFINTQQGCYGLLVAFEHWPSSPTLWTCWADDQVSFNHIKAFGAQRSNSLGPRDACDVK